MIKKGFLTFLLISSLAFGALAQEKSVLSMEEALEAAKGAVLAPQATFSDEYSTYYISYFSDSQTWEVVFFAKPKNGILMLNQNIIISLDKNGNVLNQRNM